MTWQDLSDDIDDEELWGGEVYIWQYSQLRGNNKPVLSTDTIDNSISYTFASLSDE